MVNTANSYCKFTKHWRIVWILSRGSFFSFHHSFNIKPRIVELKTSIVFPIWRRRSSFDRPATFFVPDTRTGLSFHYHVFFVNLFHKESLDKECSVGKNVLLSFLVRRWKFNAFVLFRRAWMSCTGIISVLWPGRLRGGEHFNSH